MSKTINIEVIRQHKLKHTAIIFAVCALLVACLVGAFPNTRAQYTTADQDSHIFVFFKDQDVKVGLSEDGWTAFSGLDLKSGDVRIKEPVVQNLADDCYMRVNMRITDKDGNTLSPTSDYERVRERIQLVLDTVYYDSQNSIKTTDSFTRSEISQMDGVEAVSNHSKFASPVWNETMQAYNFDYVGVFRSGDTAILFNRIVVPADYTSAELEIMDEYYINLWVQAIQSVGFNTAGEALEQLSNDNVPNDIGTNVRNSKSV